MDSRLIKPKALPKPSLLKDYLLDDMSSCSSNGFKSFPRRQCCGSTVRFLIEIDLKSKQHQHQQKKKYLNFKKNTPSLLKSPSRSALAAFRTVITAVKRLPFAAGTSPENKKPKRSILPRNLSKKILKKTSFWKRKPNHKEIQRWKSFDEFLKEDSGPLDTSNCSMNATDSKSHDLTASEECSSGNSSSEVNSNLPKEENDAVEAPKDGDVSTDSTSSSSTSNNSSSNEKQWSVSEEKEQLSPVSVLDCPFDDDDDDDDDDEVYSPFQHNVAVVEGTKKKLMKKIQKFECLAQLEPVNLAERFVLLPGCSDTDSTASPPPQSCPDPVDEKSTSDIKQEPEEDKESQAEGKALNLLQQMKDTLPSYGLKIKADKLLLDFFRERIIDQNVPSQRQWGGDSFEEELLEEAENWINGRKTSELFLAWEVPRNRGVYVKDMEKGGEWRSLDQENREVALEMEAEVFAALLSELLLDISSKAAISL
ncbi:hypothetical protein Salat_1851800 [Sesamum alatum]|uniref:DUF4378 domain-containing protein n=1 Tax=Sesamum alatum TaxID=300844 RepID=A0AAE1Y2S3_9LAMI|nr:hypothetical protein Salat_1851800 [Sesamum alatum]